MENRKKTLKVMVIGLLLLARLMSPSPVHAGGGTPPHATETPTAEPTKIPPTESPTLEPTDTVPPKPGVNVLRTQPPPKDPTATSTPKPSTESTGPVASTPEPIKTTSPEAPTLTDVLQELPGDTSVVVLDESSQVLPLASQTAANILTQSDPMWCPDGVAPGGVGCTSAYATLTDLLSNAGTYINSQTIHGVIWITSGPVADTSSIAIDGSIYTNWSNYNLTLQGGWSGIIGDTTVNPGAISVFSVPITITNWNNGIVVQNIDTPSINLSNITSAQGNGVAVTSVNSNVNLDNIRVDHAVGAGLQVVTTGAILANNISSTNNQDRIPSDFLWPQDYGIGAYLESQTSLTLIGTNVFNGNTSDGLVAFSQGDLALNNVTASSNRWNGIVADSSNGSAALNNIVTQGNGSEGLYVSSLRDLTLNNVTADSNSFDGIVVTSWYGNATLNNIATQGNGSIGLYAVAPGHLTLHNITANTNYFGAVLGSWNGDVTLTGMNLFSGNTGVGASISAFRDIILNQVTAQDNVWTGLEIYGTRDVTLNNVVANRNGTGVFIAYAHNINFSGSLITNNSTGLSVYCVNSLNRFPTFSNNTIDFYTDPWACPPPSLPPQPQTFLQTQGELFALDCITAQHRYIVRLANGDRGEIYCPVTGEASIDRVDNTTLPGTLPVGYTYVSAFDVKILKNDEAIPVITEGGHIIASFVAPNSEFGNSYSILYWDGKNSTWIPLKDFLLDQKGNSGSFELYPGVPEDERRILSGVNFVRKNGESRVEVSTNFPGIFVLAQH